MEYVCPPVSCHGTALLVHGNNVTVASSPVHHTGSSLGGVVGGVAAGRLVHVKREGVVLSGLYAGTQSEIGSAFKVIEVYPVTNWLGSDVITFPLNAWLSGNLLEVLV